MSSRSRDYASAVGTEQLGLIEQLAGHFLRNNTSADYADCSAAVKRCVKLLSKSSGRSSLKDEQDTNEALTNLLRDSARPGDVARFQELLGELHALGSLRNRAHVLQCLERLAAAAAAKEREAQQQYEQQQQQQQQQHARARPPTVFVPPAVDMHDFDTQHSSRRRSATKHNDSNGYNGDSTRPIAAAPAPAAPAESLAVSAHTSGSFGLHSDIEWYLLRDVLYAMQGIDGRHVHYDTDVEMFRINDDTAVTLSPAVRDIVLKMCEMGWLFQQVNQYVQETTQCSSSSVGLVRSAFASAIQEELTDYYRLLAVMEAQLGRSTDAMQGGGGLTLRRLSLWSMDPIERLKLMATLTHAAGTLKGGPLAACLHNHIAHGDPSVRACVHRIMKRVCAPIYYMIRQWVCEGELNGVTAVAAAATSQQEAAAAQKRGAIASTESSGAFGEQNVHPGAMRASAATSASATTTVTAAAKSSSSHSSAAGNSDFFIASCDSVEEDKLWSEKYYVDYKNLPQFISKDIAHSILIAGKAINFMRRCGTVGSAANSHYDGDDDDVYRGGWSPEDAAAAVASASQLEYGSDNSTALRQIVNECASATNQRVLHLVMVEHKLLSHLRAIKKLILLSQGDFVTTLLDSLETELDKPAKTVYPHNLTGYVDSALRGGAAQYESTDLLDRVNVRLLRTSPKDKGWDVFSLEYTVKAPLSCVIHQHASKGYSQMFHHLWRIKRVEWTLALAWRRHMSAAHSGVGNSAGDVESGLKLTLHRCSLLRAQMMHFATNLSNYMMFEVLESSWIALTAKLDTATDLDMVISAHDEYMANLLQKALLGKETASLRINEQLQIVLRIILEYCTQQERLLVQALAKVACDREQSVSAIQRTDAGKWGIEINSIDISSSTTAAASAYNSSGARRSSNSSTTNTRAGNSYTSGVDHSIMQAVQATGLRFVTAFSELLMMLEAASQKSEILRFLTFRLDFNLFHLNRLKQEHAEQSQDTTTGKKQQQQQQQQQPQPQQRSEQQQQQRQLQHDTSSVASTSSSSHSSSSRAQPPPMQRKSSSSSSSSRHISSHTTAAAATGSSGNAVPRSRTDGGASTATAAAGQLHRSGSGRALR